MSLAEDYKRRGWALALIPANDKAPRTRGWDNDDPSLVKAERHLERGGNIGLILGPRSCEAVDVDLDCSEALTLAPLYLPATEATFGRPSKPQSHRLYVAPGATYESFGDPPRDGKNTLIELRAAGREGGAHQTLIPPSVADGEHREWHGDIIAPAVVEAVALRTAVAWLAIGCLVMHYVSETAARDPGPNLLSLLWEFDHVAGRRAYDWLGFPHPDTPRRYPRPRREMTQAELDLAALVSKIPNDCDWHTWNAIGLAIFAVESSDHGLTMFDDFSAKSPKYDPHSVQERWRNYRRSPPSRTGIGKLIALRRAAGWRPPEHWNVAR
jgi:hypothetical protein